MEEYLQYMKTLRSQMTDVEDHAAKVSVEEQMQVTTISTLEKDLEHALSETKRLKEETDQKTRTRGEICSHILEKQRKISSMESDSVNIAQSLELILQERDSLSAKLVSKRSNYLKTAEEARTKLEEQKGWFISHMSNETGQQGHKKETRNNLMELSDSARAKLDQAKLMRSNLLQENSKIKLSIENVKHKINEFKPELMSVDIKILEEEYTALLSDESGEAEYLSSLQSQAEKLKVTLILYRRDLITNYMIMTTSTCCREFLTLLNVVVERNTVLV
ncbi:tropomyosin [Arabidopsis thaliana]|uniref:Tropomyosin n=1 Tax=Arabidopsis thaliana TaxID=3702 RepID=F4HR83_ARATH|nr:tropomyosin [Arabidopsis thaliana]AEE31601.1 tropomyosin [Arabidopsis thaliana]|eukprot:NP_174616.2 tropomyosin [Arabidopsis thaliana]